MLCKWGHLKVCFIHFIWVRLAYTHLVRTHQTRCTASASACSSPHCWQCHSYLNRYLETVWRVVCSVCKFKSWSFLEVKRWGVVKLNVQNGISSSQRTQTQEEYLRRDQWMLLGDLQLPLQLIQALSLPYIYFGTALIYNLVSYPLILKAMQVFFFYLFFSSLGMRVHLQFSL